MMLREWDWSNPEKAPRETGSSSWSSFFATYGEPAATVELDAAPCTPVLLRDVTDVSARAHESLVIGMAGDRYFVIFLYSYGYRAPYRKMYEACFVAINRDLFLTIIPKQLRHKARRLLDRMEYFRELDAGGRKS